MNLTKLTLVSLFIIAFSIQVFSQKEKKKASRWYNETIVELHNGSILKGKLIHQDATSVKIEIVGGSIFVFPAEEVKEITATGEKIYTQVKDYRYNREGDYLLMSATVNATDFDAGIGTHAVYGRQFNNYLAVGVGGGFTQMSVNGGIRTIPIYAEVRGNLFENPVTPIYSYALGYGFGLANTNADIIDAKGGFYMHPALGLRFDMQNGTAVIIDFGYQLHNMEITSQRFNGINIDNIQFRRFSIRVGLMF